MGTGVDMEGFSEEVSLERALKDDGRRGPRPLGEAARAEAGGARRRGAAGPGQTPEQGPPPGSHCKEAG